MAAENVLATQITLGLIGSGALQLLKKSSLVTFVDQHSKVFNHVFLLATSAAGAVGVHSVWDSTNHSLVITGLDLATIAMSFWIWAKQWAVQYLVHRGAFGSVSGDAPAATVATPVLGSAMSGSAVAGSKQPLARTGLGSTWSPAKKSLARLAFGCFAFLAIAASLLFAGCAARNVTVGQVNKSVTTVIADAGTVAISAEQAYQAGKIPQTVGARAAINDLGGAYEEAKRLFSMVLISEAAYNARQSAQMQACQPASSQGGVVSDPVNCQAATQAANTARSSLDGAQANLSTSLQALTAKTAAVKALPAQ
jgi:hypothetical protein